MMPSLGAPSGVPSGPGTLSPEDLVKLVDRMELERSVLHTRMDQDVSRWRGDPYVGDDALDGFAKFTSNAARTYADWAVSVLTGAERTVRVYQGAAHKQQRQISGMKEMFVLGVLKAVDERRANLLQPRLVDSLAWQTCIRGRYAQRVLLIKENVPPGEQASSLGGAGPGAASAPPEMGASPPEAGGAPTEMPGGEASMPPELAQLVAQFMPQTRTYVEVADWDPRNTYWQVGLHGLAWACHKVKKTRDEVLSEFGVDPREAVTMPLSEAPQPDGDSQREYWTYEWFDQDVGLVLLEGGVVLKPPTPHGMTRVPVCLGLVGSLPLIQEAGMVAEVDYGDSIYHSIRDILDEDNFMMSVMKELSHRAIKSPLVYELRDPARMPDEDARITGTDVPLQIGEKVYPLPPMEMVREAGAYLGLISGMQQRGSVSHAAFGNVQFQLSGYMFNSLRQDMDRAVHPPLKAIVTAYLQIGNLLCDAYATGMFDPMTLSGQLQGSRRQYFTETISPQVVAQGGILEIDLIPQLPQDDAAKATLAQLYRESPNGIPLADDRFIREDVLGIQDVDLMENAVLEQAAGTSNGTALAFRMMLAAAAQGDVELAKIWEQEFEMQVLQKMIQYQQLGMMGGQAGVPGGAPGVPVRPGNNGQGPRPASQVLPGPGQGVPQGAPTPQQGPLVPPGSPRPGAQNGAGVGAGGGLGQTYGPGALPPWAR